MAEIEIEQKVIDHFLPTPISWCLSLRDQFLILEILCEYITKIFVYNFPSPLNTHIHRHKL